MSDINTLADFIRKYGILGSIALIVPFIAPYVNDFLVDRQRTMLDEALDRNRQYTFKEITHLVGGLRSDIRLVSGTMVLTSDQAIYIMKTAVGYQSIYKVDWIEDFMGDHNMKYEQRAKNAIRLELYKQSKVYINSLNNFSHPKLGRLGDYVGSQFPMAKFLDNTYVIVFQKELSIKDKSESVMYLMLSMQNDLWDKAREEMR